MRERRGRRTRLPAMTNVTPAESPEPMQLGRSPLTQAERRRRTEQGLCLYCGESGHVLHSCPVSPPRPESTPKRHLWANRKPVGPVDEVWSNLYISDESTARDKATLSGLGITHIVNGADGRIRSPVSLYNDMAITCYGVQAADHPSFDLSPFFYPTAAFIQTALSQKGRVLVHCAMGVSRSATLVLAYLMIRERLPLLEAICTVKKHRHICPNSGFLEQLRHLDMVLEQERATQKEGVRPSSRVQDAIQF